MTIVKKVFWIIFGALINAIVLHFMFGPADIAAGGLGGFAIVLNRLFPVIDVGIIVLIGNVILFTLGFLLLGRQFGLLTLFGSMAYSVFIMILEGIFPNPSVLIDDRLLLVIIGSALSGFGLSFIFDQNASSGGTDILAQIMHKYTGISLAKALLLADTVVVMSSAIVIGLNVAMYAAVAIYICSEMVDKTIAGFKRRIVMNINTSHVDEVNRYINETMRRGTTIYPVLGGFSHHPQQVILTVVRQQEYIRIKDFVDRTDPQAFVFIYSANEVLGEGFTYGTKRIPQTAPETVLEDWRS